MSLSVLIDDREPLQLALAVEELGHEVVYTRLFAGDFQGKTTIGEIKRGDDLFHSITDGRLIKQAKKMYKTGKAGYLILAGNMADVRCRMEPVVRTLVNLAFNYELTIIPVMNVEVTIAYVIHRVLTDVDSKEPLPLNDSSNRYLS
ncbi:MAG: ERCC4 domain-containing protein [Candidatus Hodarchaeales archaeon]|jgi:ERCC4-type nuclease